MEIIISQIIEMVYTIQDWVIEKEPALSREELETLMLMSASFLGKYWKPILEVSGLVIRILNLRMNRKVNVKKPSGGES